MLNIVVPLAGEGVCFFDENGTWAHVVNGGQDQVKIELIVNAIRPRQEHRFIFPVLLENLGRPEIARMLQSLAPGCVIIPVARATRGEACTVLLARKMIDCEEPLLIVVGESSSSANIEQYLTAIDRWQADGAILTSRLRKAKRSYVDVDCAGRVRGIAERPVTTSETAIGMFHFRRGTDFVRSATEMIQRNLHVDNEFHIAPACRRMLDAGQKVVAYAVGESHIACAVLAGQNAA